LLNNRRSKFSSITCIVIAYNEEPSIEEAVKEVLAELKRFSFNQIEVIVVDDASTDRTNEIAQGLAKVNPEIKIIRHEKNKGPGSGIKTGIQNAKGEVVCFHAADRQLDFSEVASFIHELDDKDLLIGERKARPGYTLARRIVSKLGIGVARIFFGLKYRDYYFLYLYRRSVFQNMKLSCSGIFVVVEILVKAIDKELGVGEIKAECYPRKHGKATCGKLSVILTTFWEFLTFWFSYKILRIGR